MGALLARHRRYALLILKFMIIGKASDPSEKKLESFFRRLFLGYLYLLYYSRMVPEMSEQHVRNLPRPLAPNHHHGNREARLWLLKTGREPSGRPVPSCPPLTYQLVPFCLGHLLLLQLAQLAIFGEIQEVILGLRGGKMGTDSRNSPSHDGRVSLHQGYRIVSAGAGFRSLHL